MGPLIVCREYLKEASRCTIQMMETIPTNDQLTDAAIVTPPVVSAASGDYDSPWKEAIEQYFPAFIAFFFPDIQTL